MELPFHCPVRGRDFRSDRWRMDDGFSVEPDGRGGRRLVATVRVPCPLCGREHAYAPDELACPLSPPGNPLCGNQGGEE